MGGGGRAEGVGGWGGGGRARPGKGGPATTLGAEKLKKNFFLKYDIFLLRYHKGMCNLSVNHIFDQDLLYLHSFLAIITMAEKGFAPKHSKKIGVIP